MIKNILIAGLICAVSCTAPLKQKRVMIRAGWADRVDTLICVPLPLFRTLVDSATYTKLRYDDVLRMESQTK